MKGTGLLHPTDVIATPGYVQTCVTTTSAQAFDVPAGGGVVVFGANVDFIVAWGSTAAAVPTTSSSGSSAPAQEINPTARNVGSTASCTGYSVIAQGAGIVTASWYDG